MLIEVLNEEVGQRLNQLIEGLDYLCFNIDENKGIRQESKITHSDYYNYLLCNEQIARELGLIVT
jgi:hypothetical protein